MFKLKYLKNIHFVEMNIQVPICEISGRVKQLDISKDKKYKSIILITKSSLNFTIDLNKFFVPTQVNDLFYARCSFKNNDTQSKDLILIAEPFVQIPSDSESTKALFIKANTKHFTYDKADRLWDHLFNQAKTTENFHPYMDNMALKYHESKDQVFIESSNLSVINFKVSIFWSIGIET